MDGTTRAYGCVECQRWHYEATEPETFAAHIVRQSKHGITERPVAEVDSQIVDRFLESIR